MQISDRVRVAGDDGERGGLAHGSRSDAVDRTLPAYAPRLRLMDVIAGRHLGWVSAAMTVALGFCSQ